MAMVASMPKPLLMDMCGSMFLLQLRFMLMSLSHVTIGAFENHLMNYVLDHVLSYKGHAELFLPLTGSGRASLSPLWRVDPAPCHPCANRPQCPWHRRAGTAAYRKTGPLYLEKLAPALSTGVGELTLPLT